MEPGARAVIGPLKASGLAFAFSLHPRSESLVFVFLFGTAAGGLLRQGRHGSRLRMAKAGSSKGRDGAFIYKGRAP